MTDIPVGHSLTIHYPYLPPSSNKLHFNRPGGGRSKTKIAEQWQNRFIGRVGQDHMFAIKKLQDHVSQGAVLHFDITMLLELKDLVNVLWTQRYVRGKKKGQRKAKDRYKKLDVTNRFKLIEDSLALVFGIDDRLNFATSGKKIAVGDRDETGIVATVTIDDPRVFGIPEEFLGPE